MKLLHNLGSIMKKENQILKELLESHGLEVEVKGDWLLPNGELPAIHAHWDADASENVGQLGIEILYDTQKETIIEQFGGFGEREVQLLKAFENFSLNSLHLFLALFWNNSTEQVRRESWKIGDEEYIAYIGDLAITSVGNDEIEIPESYESLIKELIVEESLHHKFHWFGFYANNSYDIYSSSFDNTPWEKGVDGLKSLDWETREEFYGVRQFIALKRVQEELPQSWEHYFSHIEEKPAIVRFNMSLSEYLPLEGYTQRGWFRLDFLNPEENGFPSPHEIERNNEIEDSMESLIENLGGVYAGIITTNGGFNMIFYMKETEKIEKAIESLMREDFSEYEYRLGFKEDSEAESYFKLLYPSIYEYQSILNQRVLRQLDEQNDDHSVAREIDHYIVIPTEEMKSIIEERLKEMNYEIKESQFREDTESYHLSFSRVDSVESEMIDSITWELVELTQEHNASYDGWGCVIVPKEKDEKR